MRKPKTKLMRKNASPDLKSLESGDVQERFQSAVGNYIQNSKKLNSTSTNYASERLIENLKTAGDMEIPKGRKKPPRYEYGEKMKK